MIAVRLKRGLHGEPLAAIRKGIRAQKSGLLAISTIANLRILFPLIKWPSFSVSIEQQYIEKVLKIAILQSDHNLDFGMAGAGREILHKIKVKAGLGSSSAETGKGKAKMSGKKVRHGYHLVKGKSNHPMEDYVVAEYKKVDDSELGLFAIFDGHLGHDVPDYLKTHLFNNILKEPDFLTDMKGAIKKAYELTDSKILEKAVELGRGGSTAVTAILIDGSKLVVANVGDSRAVISKNGVAKQLSVDHEPSIERKSIEERGGFVSNLPGDVPRVDGQLAVARAFGDRSLKAHISSEPYIEEEVIDAETDFFILASDGLWKVMTNQEAVDCIRDIKDPQSAAKHLTEEAIARKSKDDVSCIVVKFVS